MTENKGDLISREALKKAIDKEFEKADLSDYEDCSCVCEIYDKCIDNAPTVEAYTEEQVKELVELNKKLSEERPQGEWIPIKSLMEDNHHSRISFRCNRCRYVEGYRAKYCAGCGADMRPKSSQLRDCENCIHHSDNGCEVWECKFKRRSS